MLDYRDGSGHLSPTQWIARWLFQRGRDDVRGVLALALVLGSAVLAVAIPKPAFEVLALLLFALACGLFTANFRHFAKRGDR